MEPNKELQITYVYMWGQLNMCGEELHLTIEDQAAIKKVISSSNQLVIQSPVVLSTFEMRRVISVCCTSEYTLALTAYGQTWLWGKDQLSQPVEGLQHIFVKKIAATTPGGRTTEFAAIDRDGELYTWQVTKKPEKVSLPYEVESVALGENFGIALTTDSWVFTWPSNNTLCLFPLTVLSPTQLGGAKIVQIGAGYSWFGAALSSDHNLYTWGINMGPSGGNFLGHGPNFVGGNLGPKLVESLRQRVAYFTCGYIHMMAVTVDGEVYGWGDGDTNKLGHGKYGRPYHRDVPTLIEGLSDKNVKKLSLARGNEAALTESGQVFLWGGFDFDGHYEHKVPTLLEIDTLSKQGAEVTDISGGKSHSVLVVSVAMTLTHLCFRVIAFHLTKFPNLQTQLPQELRESIACFLADRRRLDSNCIKILGLENEAIPRFRRITLRGLSFATER